MSKRKKSKRNRIKQVRPYVEVSEEERKEVNEKFDNWIKEAEEREDNLRSAKRKFNPNSPWV